jgi:hypothetical protein
MYYDATHLHDHEVSKLHLPKQKWVRQITQAFEASSEERVACPYCKELGEDVTFHHIRGLVKHIEHGKFSDMHDQLKRADGWYDAGWDKHPESKSKTFKKTLERQRQVRMAALNIRYSQYEPAPGPVLHPAISGAVLAPGRPDIAGPQPGVKRVRLSETYVPPNITDSQRPFIGFTTLDEAPRFEVPKHLEGFVKSTRLAFQPSKTLHPPGPDSKGQLVHE